MKDIITIAEPIGREWTDELICIPLPAPAAVHVVNAATGAPLPSQASATPPCVYARVSLRPGERLNLHVEPAAAPGRQSPFTIDHSPSAIAIANDRLAVEIPVSGPFDPGEAPGPVLRLRRTADAAWLGQGVWGPSDFTGRVETTILDRGPLFARWLTRYIVGGEEWARYECRLLAGEDFVWVRDATRLAAGRSFRFRLAGQDAPSEWFTLGGGEQASVARGPMTAPPPRRGRERTDEFVHVDFHSGHFQMSYSWAGFLCGGTAVGVCELNGGHWQIPGRNRILAMCRGDGIELRFPADGGAKEFALTCGAPQDYAPAAGLSRFCHLRRKHSDVPLDKVRHWVTDWALAAPGRPILYPAGSAERWEAKLKAWPELAAAYRRLAAEKNLPAAAHLPLYLMTDDDGGQRLMDMIERCLDEAVAHVMDNGYQRLIIFDGRMLKVCLEAIDVLRWRGELDEAAARSIARRVAFAAYCFADPNFWPWDSVMRHRDDPRSMGGDYWDDIGPNICPPNFTTEYHTSFALAGLA